MRRFNFTRRTERNRKHPHENVLRRVQMLNVETPVETFKSERPKCH